MLPETTEGDHPCVDGSQDLRAASNSRRMVQPAFMAASYPKFGSALAPKEYGVRIY
jgi:hypothetical protein